MKRLLFLLSYISVLFLISIIAFPAYMQEEDLLEGYQAHLYCKNGKCDRGFIVDVKADVKNGTKRQNVKVSFLDKKDKAFYNKLFTDLKQQKDDIAYVIVDDEGCVENYIKRDNLIDKIRFKKLPFMSLRNIPKNNNVRRGVCIKSKRKQEVNKEKVLCELSVIGTSQKSTSFMILKYLFYKML
ncbi:MAG: hypothetical protein ACOX3T_07200 [Bdellovibrionota bacterium]